MRRTLIEGGPPAGAGLDESLAKAETSHAGIRYQHALGIEPTPYPPTDQATRHSLVIVLGIGQS